MARLLVVDGSQLMTWLVMSVVPRGVSVEWVTSFAEAEAILRENPPDAAILNITPSRLDWNLLREICRGHRPPVQVICCEAIGNLDGGSQSTCPDERSLSKPFSINDLRQRVGLLLEEIGFQEVARRDRPH